MIFALVYVECMSYECQARRVSLEVILFEWDLN
jgi:hypothetical protein